MWKADSSAYSISACSHILFGIVVVLNQFGSKFIQSLEMCSTNRLKVNFNLQFSHSGNNSRIEDAIFIM